MTEWICLGAEPSDGVVRGHGSVKCIAIVIFYFVGELRRYDEAHCINAQLDIVGSCHFPV